MSHHYSGPDFGIPYGDARLDFTDLYAFPKPGDASKSIVIMNVHRRPARTLRDPLQPTINGTATVESVVWNRWRTCSCLASRCAPSAKCDQKSGWRQLVPPAKAREPYDNEVVKRWTAEITKNTVTQRDLSLTGGRDPVLPSAKMDCEL